MVDNASSSNTFTTRAMQVVIGLVVLVPALEVLLGNRNLMIEDFKEYLESLSADTAIPIMRLATFLAVVLSLAVIGVKATDQRRPRTGLGVLGAFLVLYVTNVVLSGLFGEVPEITRSHVYPLIIFVALYMSRDDGAEPVLDAGKVSLLVMVVASLVCMIALPHLTRRVYAPEVRLPYIDFRFWGLGASANGFGPLGLLLVLLTIDRPFRSRLLTWIGLASGALVVLLAQSQTTWIISIVMLPLFLLYRAGLLDPQRSALLSAPVVIGALVAGAVAYLFAWMFWFDHSTSNLVDAGAGDIALTGRTVAWAVAWDLFERNMLFGYGLTAWGLEFRERIQMLWAVHAHNQLMQSLSTAGLVGGIGLIVYLGALLRASLRLAWATRGLAPAMLAIMLVRSITEAPLDMGAALLGEAVVHLLLFRQLASTAAQPAEAPFTEEATLLVLNRPIDPEIDIDGANR